MFLPKRRLYLFLFPKHKTKVKCVFIVHLQVCQRRIYNIMYFILNRLGTSKVIVFVTNTYMIFRKFSFKSDRKPMLVDHVKTKKNKKKWLAHMYSSPRLVWLQVQFFLGRQTALSELHIPLLGKDPCVRYS